MRAITALTSLLVASLLAGCSTLPKAGPSSSTIVDKGTATAPAAQPVSSPYAIVDINENVVAALGRHRPLGFDRSFGVKGPAPAGVLGVGDMIAISIYEASPGGLFGSGDVGTGIGTKNVQLPPQQIGRDGRITVPFAGQVRAAGYTPGQLSNAITSALSPKAIEPQVMVSLVTNASSVVTVSGEVGQGGRFPLSLKGDRVLDAIAEAGGPRTAAHDIYVRLVRGSRSAVIRMSELLARPDQNVYLRAGDQIFLYQNPESFTVLGAAGKNADVNFEGNNVTLVEAIGKAGGLDDNRSDPAGVFVFRYEDACTYSEIQRTNDCNAQRGARIPVVYRLNLREPSSLLIAQRFYLHDKDVLYISTSPSTELYKFLQLVGVGVGMAGTTANISQIGR